MGLDYKVEKDLHMDVLNETAQMLSQILVIKAPTEEGMQLKWPRQQM